jgi:hypothetical protein
MYLSTIVKDRVFEISRGRRRTRAGYSKRIGKVNRYEAHAQLNNDRLHPIISHLLPYMDMQARSGQVVKEDGDGVVHTRLEEGRVGLEDKPG